MKDYAKICCEISPCRVDEVMRFLQEEVERLPDPWYEDDFQKALDRFPRDARIVMVEANSFGCGIFMNKTSMRWVMPGHWTIAKMLARYEERREMIKTKMVVANPSVTMLEYLCEEQKEILEGPKWEFDVVIPPAFENQTCLAF